MIDKRQTLKNELSKIGQRRTFLRNTLRCRYISQHTLKECVYDNISRLTCPLEGLDHYGRLKVYGEIDNDKYSIKINKELIKEWEKELRELTFKEKELNRELRKITDNEQNILR